jgi:hypothetical protein
MYLCIFFCFRSANRGNFLEILHWAAKTDPVVQSIFEDSTSNATYLSHDVQNELLHIMGDEIREEISSMVNHVYLVFYHN